MMLQEVSPQAGFDWTSIISPAGAFVGALLGARITFAVQARSLKHTDRTRFHDRRLEVYTKFLGLADLIVVTRGAGMTPDPEAMKGYYESVNMVRLVGTADVLASADGVQAVVSKMAREPDVRLLGTLLGELKAQIASFRAAARKEMGVP
jgi:hypothetical protein